MRGGQPTQSDSEPGLSERFTAALGDRYQLIRELGSGGTAVVFLAEDSKHRRKVAVKVLRPGVSAIVGPARFLREIEIIATLTHPHILPLHDSGESAGLLYYVMPYVEGPTLRTLLDRRSHLSLAEATAIATDVADALQFAHDRGVIHRDVKPENILLEAGHAVVSDFGTALARDYAASATLTAEHMAIGTPRYMSPEQRAAVSPADARSDVYSLGAVVYEMLSGEMPVTGPSPVAAPGRRAPKPLRGLRGASPGLARTIERALDRALAPLPADRFPTVAAFAQELRAPVRRRRLVLAVGAGALVAGAGLARLLIPASVPTGLRPNRVVVSRFVNQTGVDSLDRFGVMAAYWLTDGLEQTGRLEVVPTESRLHAEGAIERDIAAQKAAATVPTLWDETGAGKQISGSYTLERDSIVLHVEVIDAVRGRTVRIDPVRRPLAQREDALLEARSRVVGLLAAMVDESLAAFVGAPVRPLTYAAYLEASEGMQAYVRNEFDTAARRLRRAWATDTTFVAPLLLASISLSNLGQFAAADSLLDVLERNRARLTTHQQHWVDYRRALMAGDHAGALAAVRLVAAEEPGSKAVFNHAAEAVQNGYLTEAQDALLSLEPDRGPMRGWLSYWEVLGSVYHLKGHYQEELKTGNAARKAHPDRLFALIPSVRALAALGRVDELIALLSYANRMPRDPVLGVDSLMREAATELGAHGAPDAARQVWEQSLAWAAARVPPGGEGTEARASRAATLAALGRFAEAAPVADSLLTAAAPNIEHVGLRGLIAARAGDGATVARIDRQLAAEPRRYSFGVPTLWRARIAAALGERDSALALVQQSFAEGREYDLWLHRDRDLDGLRALPQFIALTRPRD